MLMAAPIQGWLRGYSAQRRSLLLLRFGAEDTAPELASATPLKERARQAMPPAQPVYSSLRTMAGITAVAQTAVSGEDQVDGDFRRKAGLLTPLAISVAIASSHHPPAYATTARRGVLASPGSLKRSAPL